MLSILSADFRLKIFLWIFLDYGVSNFHFIDFEGVEVILEPELRNVISIEHTTSANFVVFG